MEKIPVIFLTGTVQVVLILFKITGNLLQKYVHTFSLKERKNQDINS